MLNPMDLTGKRILVTGATSGIGKACAILAAKRGASVVLIGRNQERLDESVRMLDGTGHIPILFDLANILEIESLFVTACKDNQKLDGLVHAAGARPAIPIQSVTLAQMKAVMEINYWAFLELAKNISKKKYSAGGSVVAISSVSAKAGWPGGSLYCGSKGALDASVRALALEFVHKKIRVNSVVPSNIRTPMFEDGTDTASEASMTALFVKQPLGLGEPEDVAHAVAFLLSDAARFITGTTLVVDGGYLAQ
jgi:NAD(P)-dependent dehydrogenase (short-subunit alcohol dehydrogenase family)